MVSAQVAYQKLIMFNSLLNSDVNPQKFYSRIMSVISEARQLWN